MDSRFVRPDVKVLTISNGDTLVVRERLTAGEKRARFTRMTLAGVSGDLKINPMQVGLATITAFLLDWSLRDGEGKPVVIRDMPIDQLERTLDQLDPEAFDEIKAAIDAHEDAMAAARDAQKKILSGAAASSVTSNSPSAVAGATNGSGTSTPTSTSSSLTSSPPN